MGSKPYFFMTEQHTSQINLFFLGKVAHTCEPSLPKVQARRQVLEVTQPGLLGIMV